MTLIIQFYRKDQMNGNTYLALSASCLSFGHTHGIFGPGRNPKSDDIVLLLPLLESRGYRDGREL